MDDETRKRCTAVLQTAVSDKKSAKLFEKYIHEQIANIDENDQEKMYFWFAYQIVGLTLQNKKNLLSDVKQGNIGWKSTSYHDITVKIEEHDDYIVMPFEVVEGVVKCPKCGGKKTWSMQKQTRNSDEPMTTFSRCVNCDHRWKYAG